MVTIVLDFNFRDKVVARSDKVYSRDPLYNERVPGDSKILSLASLIERQLYRNTLSSKILVGRCHI